MVIVKLCRSGIRVEHKDRFDPNGTRYLCRQCGNPARGRFHYYCSEEHREQFLDKMGIWSMVRQKALKRDRGRCVICGGAAKEVDHIKPVGDYPELEFDMDNLRSLCVGCHNKYGKRPNRRNKRDRKNTKLEMWC